MLLEAAASALPVVATNVGGTAEIFPPGSNTAWLIPPDDPTALASAITGLLANETLRSEMGAAARRRVAEAFDVRRAATGLLGHYRFVLGGTP